AGVGVGAGAPVHRVVVAATEHLSGAVTAIHAVAAVLASLEVTGREAPNGVVVRCSDQDVGSVGAFDELCLRRAGEAQHARGRGRDYDPKLADHENSSRFG